MWTAMIFLLYATVLESVWFDMLVFLPCDLPLKLAVDAEGRSYGGDVVLIVQNS